MKRLKPYFGLSPEVFWSVWRGWAIGCLVGLLIVLAYLIGRMQ